jgi:ankyrin repeat protein
MDATQTFKDPQVVALVQAIEREDLPGIDLAIERGANINAVGERGQTPLHWSLLKVGIAVKTVQHLLERGADPNAPMSNGQSPLFLTSGSSRPDPLELFLQHRGNPNVFSRIQETPLMNAIASQYEINVNMLLKFGADPNLGETCLSTVGNARFDFTVELLRNGLTKDLPRCGRLVYKTVIPEDSSQQAWRTKVFEMLAERGVVPPFADK